MKAFPLFLTIVGALGLCVLLIFEIVPLPYDNAVLQRSPLLNGTKEWDRWAKQKTVISLYFFNVTNPASFKIGAKPTMTEVGPYVYEEKRQKFVVQETDGLVEFKVNLSREFRPDFSDGNEDDEILVPNIPLIIMAEYFATTNDTRPESLNIFNTLKLEGLFLKVKLGEFLHEGMEFPIPGQFERAPLQPSVMKHEENWDFQVKSGDKSLDEVGQIIIWAGWQHLPSWKGHCRLLRGTDGTIFPPNLSRNELIIYVHSVGRTFTFKFARRVSLNGVEGYRFEMSKDAMEYPGFQGSNSCYCQKTTDGCQICPRNGTVQGVYELGGEFGTIVYSMPHFLDGGADLKSMVNGLKPQAKLHRSYLVIEPKSGFVLDGHFRFQLNVNVESDRNVSGLSGVSEAIYPILWWDQMMKLEDGKIWTALQEPQLSSLLGQGKWLVFGFSILIMVCGIFIDIYNLVK